jgi:hypothetical protein
MWIDRSIDSLLGTISMKKEEIERLIDIVVTKSIQSEEHAKALDKVVRFNNKIQSYTIEPIIVNSLFVAPYNDKIDLDELKNDNRLYTLLIARTKDGIDGEAYIIMYQEPPIEFRKPENTGFDNNELQKLLLR